MRSSAAVCSLCAFCVLLLFLGFVAFLIPQGGLDLVTERTINEVDISQYPYMVSIERGGRHHCAGAVISRYFVLTAAHCFQRISNYSVRAGSTTVQRGGSLHKVEQVIRHPKYTSWNIAFDVALLKVSPPFALSSKLGVMKLGEFGDSEPGDYIAVLTGWGHTKSPLERSRALRRVELRVLYRSECGALAATLPTLPSPADTLSFDALTLCASYDAAGEDGDAGGDPYVGDPGAPLVVGGEAVGVASWRLMLVQGDAPGPYGLFASVAALRPWIDAHSDAAGHARDDRPL